MDLSELSRTFEANKVPILGAAAAGVVGFALWQKRKSQPAAPAQGVATVGYSGGGQTAGMNGAGYYDSSASDVYGLLQPQLESLGGQVSDLSSKLNAVPVSTAPTSSITSPIAATELAPNMTGTYVGYTNGGIYEVQSDGSLYHLSGPEWSQVIQHRGGDASYATIGGSAPGTDYSYIGNLAGKINQAAGGKTS